MCILCGELIMNVHWTDQPLHDIEYRNSTRIVAGSNQRARMRSRLKRVNIANKILAYYGLNMKEFNGSRYVLYDKKGSSQIVYDLGGVWNIVFDMCHKKPDPLDPDFLHFLSEEEVPHV